MEARTTSPGDGLLGSSRRAPGWEGARALGRHLRPAGFVGLSVVAHVVLSAVMPAESSSFSGESGAPSHVAVAITEVAPKAEKETRPAPSPEPAAVPIERGAHHDPTPDKRPDPEPAPGTVTAEPEPRAPEPAEPTKPPEPSKKKEPAPTNPPAAGTPKTDEDETEAVVEEAAAEGEVQVASSHGEDGGAPGGHGEEGPAGGTGGSARADEGTGGSGHGGGVDLRGLVRAYMTRVARVLREGHDYPRAARRAGHEGTVQLAITIDPRGRIEDVHVARSSGHDTLDEAAVASVRMRGKVPAPPPELHWRTRPVQLPIAYRLQ